MLDLTIPTQAMPLLGDDYVICHNPAFAHYIARNSRGGLVIVRSGRDFLLVPAEVWERVREDVAGIECEIAAKQG